MSEIHEIGSFKGAIVRETEDGKAVVQLSGGKGVAQIVVPEHMAVPFSEGVARNVQRVYQEADE